MKKILALFLSLIMLLSAASALAEAAPADGPVPLPQVGDVVFGFEAKEIRDFPLYGSQLVLFEHQKTGAKLMYIANEDTNRAFQLVFPTRQYDNTGLPHVFEHATTSGSEKYPSTTLWFDVSYQTYNTYINAHTTDAMTWYPVASLSEVQLLHLADYYTDLCLHPLIMTEESIFTTEAWRYEMTDLDAPLTYNGTVYSEMTGAMTLERMASLHGYETTFPGASVAHQYGGLPENIPDMTWEDIKAYHDQYYHPSNCLAVLYGAFDDYTAFLQLLDEAFSPYEKKEFTFEEPLYQAITEPVVASFPYPTAADADPANKSTIFYYILCPGIKGNSEQEALLDHVCELLADSSSPLMQNLLKALPTAQVGIGRELAGPEDAICFTAYYVNPEDAELFKQTVDQSLAQIAEENFAPELLDILGTRLKLSSKLSGEDSDPVMGIMENISYYYATTGNPFAYVENVEALDNLNEEYTSGKLVETLKTYLIDPSLYTLTTTYPAPGEKEKQDEALAAKLAEIKAGMTDEEKQAIVDATNAEVPVKDNSELVAKIKAVDVASLPEEIRDYEVFDTVGEDGVRRLEIPVGIDDVGTVTFWLDASALPQDQIHYFRMFTRLLGDLPTDAHTKDELDSLINRYLYNQTFGIEVSGTGYKKPDGTYCPYLFLQWTALGEDLEKSYDLVQELVYHTQFTDTAMLLERIQAQKASVRSTLSSNAYSTLLFRQFGVSDPSWRYYSYLNGLDFYAFLEELETALQEDPASVTAQFEAVQSFLANRNGAIVGTAGDAEWIIQSRPLTDAFLAALRDEPRDKVEYDLPIPAVKEGLILDSNIQFNLVTASFDQMGIDKDYSLSPVASVISSEILIPQLRDQLGVYSPVCQLAYGNYLYLLAYRDPNVAETFAVYDSLPEQIAALDLTQDVIDGYILSDYSILAQPEGELTGAVNRLDNIVSGIPEDEALTQMKAYKSVTPETVKAAAEVFTAMLAAGARGTAGSAAAVSANADLYDVVLNPFGNVDNSGNVLEDVPEDHEYYAGIRFVYENNIMAPLTDTTFGPDENATNGDLLAGVYPLLGGGYGDAQGCKDFLLQYQLVPPKLNLNASLTEKFLCELVNALYGEEVLTTDTPDTIVTRGDLADLLYQMNGGGQ